MSQFFVAATAIPPPPTVVETLTGNTGGAVGPTGNNINTTGSVVAAGTTPFQSVGNPGTSTVNWQVQISQAIASTNATNIGLAAFNSADFTVDANGFVSLTNPTAFAYKQISTTYMVAATDYYLSCDSSGGAFTISLPNSATLYQEFIIKDRTGNASGKNISVTTVGGGVTIDGQTTYTIAANYTSISLLWNGTSYEIF